MVKSVFQHLFGCEDAERQDFYCTGNETIADNQGMADTDATD